MKCHRYGSFRTECIEDHIQRREWAWMTRSAIQFFLALWIQKLPQDFRKSPDHIILKKLLVYLWHSILFSNLHLHVQKLMSQLEEQEDQEIHEEEEFCSPPNKPIPRQHDKDIECGQAGLSLPFNHEMSPVELELPMGHTLLTEDNPLLSQLQSSHGQ
ncbi:hypothetical protein ACRRTK_008335 [Alexandromys fortis]